VTEAMADVTFTVRSSFELSVTGGYRLSDGDRALLGPRPDLAASSGSRRPSRPAIPCPPGFRCRTTPRSSWATCPASAAPAGPVPLRPGDLILMDEASTAATPDLADVITQAAAAGAKVILAGDTQQLQAVENGGGMSLLADAQLTDPVRFRAAWEQAASLRLRDGDTSVLAEYDQHGRIYGGEPEQMMDAAAAAYVALTLDGTDTLLMVADHALRRELPAGSATT
jgi:AAA domain-containing protein